jgi:hypothetical protein
MGLYPLALVPLSLSIHKADRLGEGAGTPCTADVIVCCEIAQAVAELVTRLRFTLDAAVGG